MSDQKQPCSSFQNPSAATAGTLEPAWYGATLRAITGISQFGENWDRCGARRIDPAIADSAMALLASVMRDETPAPSVVPTTRGGIQLEWHTRGIDLEVEFLSPSRVAGIFEDQRSGDCWEANLSTNLKPLTDAIAKLSRQ